MTDDIALGRALISELIVNHGVAGAAQLLRAAADALEEDAGFEPRSRRRQPEWRRSCRLPAWFVDRPGRAWRPLTPGGHIEKSAGGGF